MNAYTALTIAGSDPSGGAGIQADLKTFHQHGVYGMAVVTLLTVQNTKTVQAVEVQPPALVGKQLRAVLDDIQPGAAKTGALGSIEVITEVAEHAKKFRFPLVVDPVMVSKHGMPLLDSAAVDAFRKHLLPLATLVTPNIHEAQALLGEKVNDVESMKSAARRLSLLGPKSVLVKGGHLSGAIVDVLFTDGSIHLLQGERIDTKNTHGTGCVLSAAITARISRGEGVLAAVTHANHFVSEAIRTNPRLGSGFGPINMFARVD